MQGHFPKKGTKKSQPVPKKQIDSLQKLSRLKAVRNVQKH